MWSIHNASFDTFKANIYLWSDSTTVPLADAKLSGPFDAFKKGFQIKSILSLLKRDDNEENGKNDMFLLSIMKSKILSPL